MEVGACATVKKASLARCVTKWSVCGPRGLLGRRVSPFVETDVTDGAYESVLAPAKRIASELWKM